MFEISSDKFLGYLVSVWGIMANPNKIQLLVDMKLHSNLKFNKIMENSSPWIGSYRGVLKNVYLYQIIEEKHFNFFEWGV